MKTTRDDAPNCFKSYPKLMICTTGTDDYGMVVLMSMGGVGTVVHSPGRCTKAVGYHSEGWSMACFMDFNGSVKLEN